MSQLDLVWRGPAEDESPGSDPSPVGLRLVTPIRESTWLGRDPDGRSVTARRLADLPDPADLVDIGDDPADGGDPAADKPAGVVERAAVLTSVRAPSLVRTLGVQRANGTLWLVSELDDGVWLSRLLELTRPSPAQAVLVGLSVLCALRTVHAAGYAHGNVCAGEVRVGRDGQVRLDGWVTGALGGSARRGSELMTRRQRADLAAVGVLLAHLARVARRSPACADDAALARLTALDAAADHAVRPGAGIERVATLLAAACGPDDDAAARSELAVLVRAATVSGAGPSFGSGAAVRPQSLAVAEDAAPEVLPGANRATGPGAWLREVWERIWKWVVALAVLMAVVSLEFTLLHDRLAQDLQLLLGSGQAGQGGTASAEPAPAELPPVSRPAPASSGAVDGLDLRALEPCRPGAACAVRVLVQLHPQPQADDQPPLPPRTVQWSFRVIDRCTGSQRSVPGGAVSAASGNDQVQAVSTVLLPSGPALAVIAVTDEPARAASGPLLVPVRDGSCPSN